MAKIFGIGFPKTGTTSLEFALETLGYRVLRGHWKFPHTFYLQALYIHRDYDEIFRLTDYWDAFADTPWGGTDLYEEISRRLPDSRFILTLRDPDSWYESLEKLLTMFDLDHGTCLASYHANGMYGSGYYFESLFDIKTLAGNRRKIIDRYNAQNERALEFCARHPNSLVMTLDSPEYGWESLCGFLGKPCPETPFPRANPAEDNPYLSNPVDDATASAAGPSRLGGSISS